METLELMDRLPGESDVYPIEACPIATCAEMTTTITYTIPAGPED